MTIAETVWVLDRVYGMPGLEIAVAVERILQADTLIVQNERRSYRVDHSPNRCRVILRRVDWRYWRLGGLFVHVHFRQESCAA